MDTSSLDFIKDNIIPISVIIAVILSLLAFFNLKGINLNPPKPESKLVHSVTIEGMAPNNFGSNGNNSLNTYMADPVNSEQDIDNLNTAPADFCKSFLGKKDEMQEACSELTETNCNQTSCCIWTSNKKCAAGYQDGPIYKTDKEGKLITMDYYYYQGQCYGEGCMNE